MAINGQQFIASRLRSVQEQVRQACLDAGRAPSEVHLVAVSKGHPASSIREAYHCGQRDFGENFAQELKDKARELSDLRELRWHFIGRFQSNKANVLVRVGARVQTVSKYSHLEALSKRRLRTPVPCMIQVRFDNIDARSGAQEEELAELVQQGRALSGVELTGLMLVAPQSDDARATLQYFRRLVDLADALDLPERSMGMSGDYPLAIEAGSTCVRIGTAIFGERRTL